MSSIAPDISLNDTSEQIENMNAVELQRKIAQLKVILSQLIAYSSSRGVDVPASEADVQTFEQQQEQMINNLNSQISALRKRLEKVNGQINTQSAELKSGEQELSERQARILAQQREIDNKKKLVESRNRMLQLSIEKNVYKKKVIYSLISAIIAVLILMLLGYSYMNRS
jgi:hypothetical protein